MQRSLWCLGALALLCSVAYVVFLRYYFLDVLIVGHITADLVQLKARTSVPVTRVGGAVSYAGVIAAALGHGRSACVVTSFHDVNRTEPFLQQHLQVVHVVPSASTLTFEHTYTWWHNYRVLRVPTTTNVTLSAAHVPLRCRFARTVLLGPLLGSDVDAASFSKPDGLLRKWFARFQSIGLMAQGFQRTLTADRKVESLTAPSRPLLDALTPRVTLFLSDVEVDTWSSDDVARVVAEVDSMIVTRGEKGATLYSKSAPTVTIPAYPIDAVDTNGAGDTFATAFMLAKQSAGRVDAGRAAAWAASRVCLQPQSCKPHCLVSVLNATSAMHAPPHS